MKGIINNFIEEKFCPRGKKKVWRKLTLAFGAMLITFCGATCYIYSLRGNEYLAVV